MDSLLLRITVSLMAGVGAISILVTLLIESKMYREDDEQDGK